MQKQSSVKVISTRFKHIIHQIPNNWESSQVSEVTEVLQSGISRLLSPYDIGYVMLTSENIQNSNLDTTNKKYWYKIDNQGVDLKKYILDDGDIILNFINSTAQIGKSCIFKKQERDWIFTTNVFRIKVNKHIITPEFFHKLIQTKFIQKQILAITQPAINQASFSKTDFNKVIIYYPPLKEQQKITSILSNVDELIQKTDQIIEQTQRLKKGLMQRLLTKGIGHTKFKKTELEDIPEEWIISPLESVSEKVSVGIATSTTRHFVKEGIPLLRNQNIKEDYIDTTDLMHITEEFSRLNSSRALKEGDVICVRTGYPGQSAVVPLEMEGWHTFTTLIVRPLKNKIDSYYLSRFLNSIVKTKIKSLQAGGSQQNLNAGWLSKINIKLPSLKEQQKIASILSNVDELIQTQQVNKSNLEYLKKGLMQQLLTGKIRVKM